MLLYIHSIVTMLVYMHNIVTMFVNMLTVVTMFVYVHNIGNRDTWKCNASM